MSKASVNSYKRLHENVVRAIQGNKIYILSLLLSIDTLIFRGILDLIACGKSLKNCQSLHRLFL